jgi:hypothetical protein
MSEKAFINGWGAPIRGFSFECMAGRDSWMGCNIYDSIDGEQAVQLATMTARILEFWFYWCLLERLIIG